MRGSVKQATEGGEGVKCKECESEELYPMDTDDHECDCGAMYCGNCDAEYSKEGELLSGGLVSNG